MVRLSYADLCIYWQWPGFLGKIQPFFVIASCFLFNLSIGAYLAIGNLLPYVVSYVRYHSHPSSLRMHVAAYVYAVQLVGIGSAVMLGSLLEKRLGPRVVLFFGGGLMVTGASTSYYTIKYSFWFFVFTFGFVNGLGIGLSYVSPIACAMKWLPKWKGLVSGIVVAGVGLSPPIFNTIQTGYINPHNFAPDYAPYPSYPDEKYFSQNELLRKVPYFFLVQGICYAVIISISLICIANPYPIASPISTPNPDSAKDINADCDEKTVLINSKRESLTQEVPSLSPLQMCKTLNFYLLLFIFIFDITIKSFFAPLYKSFGLEKVTTNDHFITIAGSVGAVCNLFGRILWPFFADLTSYKTVLVFQGAFMTCFLSTLFVTSVVGKIMYFVWVCAIFFGIGGYASIFPTAVVKSFGPRDISLNYGIIASVSFVVGPLVASFIAQMLVRTIDWYGTFFVLSGMSCLTLLVAVFYRHKTYKIE